MTTEFILDDSGNFLPTIPNEPENNLNIQGKLVINEVSREVEPTVLPCNEDNVTKEYLMKEEQLNDQVSINRSSRVDDSEKQSASSESKKRTWIEYFYETGVWIMYKLPYPKY